MLVDLGRNDLGRVCVPGTVEVVEFMEVRRYSHIMHLESTVTGQVAAGRTALDVVLAAFPAGTLSGAPKVRAMEIIDELEVSRRGLYGGVVGYLDFAGDADAAIAIRTALLRDGVAYVQAGGGIVADSDPPTEDQESQNKAAAVVRAIAVAQTLHARSSAAIDGAAREVASRRSALGCCSVGGCSALVAGGPAVVAGRRRRACRSRFTGTEATGGLSQALASSPLAGMLLVLVLRGPRPPGGRRAAGAGRRPAWSLVGLLRLRPSADAVRTQVREVSLADQFALRPTGWPWVYAGAGLLVARRAPCWCCSPRARLAGAGRPLRADGAAPGARRAPTPTTRPTSWQALDAGRGPDRSSTATPTPMCIRPHRGHNGRRRHARPDAVTDPSQSPTATE